MSHSTFKAKELNAPEAFAIGHILLAIPRRAVDSALASTDRSKRRDGRFPDTITVYFVLLMGLFMELSYDHLLLKVQNALKWLNFGDGIAGISNSAVVQARKRIGPKVLECLFKLLSKPVCTSSTPKAFLKDLRIVAIDGSTLNVADSPNNTKSFGKPKNQKGECALPQLRFVTIIEFASRVVLAANFGPVYVSTENELCKPLLANLAKNTLCLGDKLYGSYINCKIINDTGAKFLFRVRKDLKLKPKATLKDGSYLATMKDRRDGVSQSSTTGTTVVRVIPYRLNGSETVHRLVTNILDPGEVSAQELVDVYPHRWTAELVYREIKATLKQAHVILRSQSSELVEQELYGIFCTYNVVRNLMFEAACAHGLTPEMLSFKHSLTVIKDELPEIGNFPPSRVRKKTL